MSDFQRYIKQGIKKERVSIMINRWRIKQQKARLAVIESLSHYFKTGNFTFDEKGAIDLWEELRDFNYTPIRCQNWPLCNTGIFMRYKYEVISDDGDDYQVIDDIDDYNYYCWSCYKKEKNKILV